MMYKTKNLSSARSSSNSRLVSSFIPSKSWSKQIYHI